MDAFSNLDLLSVGVAVAGTVLLGFVILFNDLRSATNRAFFAFAIVTACWSVLNFLSYQLPASDVALWLQRTVIFFATWHAFTFFHLASVFPARDYRVPFWHVYVLVPITSVVSLLTLTPYVFERINAVGANGAIGGIENGPAIPFFGILVLLLIVVGITKLVRKTVQAPKTERSPYGLMLAGMIVTFMLLLIFNFLIPAIVNDPQFIPFGALFLMPFVLLTSYAIYRHHLLNLRVVATAILGFMVTIFTFVNVLYSTSTSAVVINVTAFIIVLLGSIRIVRDTLTLEALAEELSATNVRQEGLIRFISHEVKGFLTKDQGAFAALLDGDFGKLSDELKPFVTRALGETRTGVDSVMNILKASNQKKGTTEYKKEPFDLDALAKEVVEELRPQAQVKGLTLSYAALPAGAPYTIIGDKAEIGDHVLHNLIDNAISYTPAGSISVSLERSTSPDRFVCKVKDTGVGIAEEDKKRLFTEGGHGKDSQVVNVHSTGYGLFIAKNIVLAHGGAIRAESEGPGKGSTFVVELPLARAGEEEAAKRG